MNLFFWMFGGEYYEYDHHKKVVKTCDSIEDVGRVEYLHLSENIRG